MERKWESNVFLCPLKIRDKEQGAKFELLKPRIEGYSQIKSSTNSDVF